jgi:hypothetical protein
MSIYPKLFRMVSFLLESYRSPGAFILSLMRATCSNHLIVLDVITTIIYVKEYTSWNSSLSSIYRFVVFSSRMQIFSSGPFTRKPPILYFTLKVRHHHWHTNTHTHTYIYRSVQSIRENSWDKPNGPLQESAANAAAAAVISIVITGWRFSLQLLRIRRRTPYDNS